MTTFSPFVRRSINPPPDRGGSGEGCILLSSSSLKLDLVLQTAQVLPCAGDQLVSGCRLSESCDHVQKIQIYSNIDKIIIPFMEMQTGGRSVGSWLVLTQAGGGQQGCPSLHLLRKGQQGRERFSLVLFHTTFPQGPQSPSAVTLLLGKCLCLILMQPIN